MTFNYSKNIVILIFQYMFATYFQRFATWLKNVYNFYSSIFAFINIITFSSNVIYFRGLLRERNWKFSLSNFSFDYSGTKKHSVTLCFMLENCFQCTLTVLHYLKRHTTVMHYWSSHQNDFNKYYKQRMHRILQRLTN